MEDQKGQTYENVSLPSGTLRVTCIPNGWTDGPTIRLQIEDEHGHIRPGPEVPYSAIGEIVGAVVRLLHPDPRP